MNQIQLSAFVQATQRESGELLLETRDSKADAFGSDTRIVLTDDEVISLIRFCQSGRVQ